MQRERLNRLVKECDCKPDPAIQAMVDEMILMALILNKENKKILKELQKEEEVLHSE